MSGVVPLVYSCQAHCFKLVDALLPASDMHETFLHEAFLQEKSRTGVFNLRLCGPVRFFSSLTGAESRYKF